jgi:hypothetical protein
LSFVFVTMNDIVHLIVLRVFLDSFQTFYLFHMFVSIYFTILLFIYFHRSLRVFPMLINNQFIKNKLICC